MSVSPKPAKPRILIVTPEITYLPSGMGNMAQRMSAKAGGLADVSASLVSALFELGADVHVAMPNYRRMFQGDIFSLHEKELRKYHEVLPEAHIHLAEDRIFYYRDQVYSNHQDESMRIALVFQREVINHIVPRVMPGSDPLQRLDDRPDSGDGTPPWHQDAFSPCTTSTPGRSRWPKWRRRGSTRRNSG